MPQKLIPAIIVISLFSLGGCSFFKPEFEPFTSPPAGDTSTTAEDSQPTEVRVEALPDKKESQSDIITIRWLVPKEPVDGYVIRYGFKANDLDYEERVKWSELQTEVDAASGKVFVHNLRGVPRDMTVYISLAGQKDDQISEPTNMFSVSPSSR